MQNKGPANAPASVDFIASIPLTGLGMPDKKLLRAQYQQNLTSLEVGLRSSRSL